MSAQATVKAKVFFAILVFAAAGLFAADRVGTSRDATVDIAPHAGLPAHRDADPVAAPRECDASRGIDNACTYN